MGFLWCVATKTSVSTLQVEPLSVVRMGRENCRFLEFPGATIVKTHGLIDSFFLFSFFYLFLPLFFLVALAGLVSDFFSLRLASDFFNLFSSGISGVCSNYWLWLLIYSLQKTEGPTFRKQLTWSISCNASIGTIQTLPLPLLNSLWTAATGALIPS